MSTAVYPYGLFIVYVEVYVEAKKCVEIKSWPNWLLLKANHVMHSIYLNLLFVICLITHWRHHV